MTVVVVNHLRLRDRLEGATVEAAESAVQAVVAAGATAAQVVRVDETHLIRVLTFATADDAGRISREIGGPWMREHIVPLLAEPTDRSVGEVIASA